MKTDKNRLIKPLVSVLILALLLTSFGVPLSGNGIAYAAEDATTLYVVPTGNDNTGCGASSAPCKTVQYAVNKAASGDTIRVAAGNYTYLSANDACTFLVTRAVVCFVDKHLTILGGFAAGSWSVSNPPANPTIIDGGNSRRGVAIIAYNSTASLRMEGFTVQNGLAQGSTSSDDYLASAYGGGVWAQNSAVTLRNMILRSNRAVGGNRTTQYGGSAGGGGLAIQSTKNGVVSIVENTVFENNQAVSGSGDRRGGIAIGGGIYTYDSTLQGSGIQFLSNTAQAGSSSGSGLDSIVGLYADAMGGGAGFQIGSSATLSNITAIGNQAIGGDAGTASGARGGGAFGAALCAEAASLTVSVAYLSQNTAIGGDASNGGMAFGGAVMTNVTHTILDRVEMINNAAISGATRNSGSAGSPAGGGAYLTGFATAGYTAQIINSIFADNRVEVGSPGASPGGGGAGLVIQAIDADILHTTFARNYFVRDVKVGQAVAIQGTYGASGVPATAYLQNVIVADHVNNATDLTAAVYVAQGSSANLNIVLFSGNTNDTNLNGKPLLPGSITGMNTSVYAASVQFVSPGTPSYDYHIEGNSPALNTGVSSSVTTDIDGGSRPLGNRPDIGADEYTDVGSGVGVQLYIPFASK